MTRSTPKIVLGLISSAMLLGCCFFSCVDVQEREEKDEKGQVHRRRHYGFRPFHFFPGGWGGGWTYGRSYSPTWGRSGGGSRTSTGTTSRSGFGGTGHSTAGG